MDENAIRQLLDDVRSGSLDPDDAVARLRRLPFADIGFAKVDHHRPLRQGLLEAVYGPGKTPDQCAAIVAELLAEPAGQPVLLTRADPDQVAAALERNPGGRRTPTSAGGDQGTHRAVHDLSLVAGVTPAPVVAVPTSTGYGAAFEGIAALLAMLSSCAAGVTVVGIDNGFGAACAVSRLLG